MIRFDRFFDRIFVLNLKRRPDRRRECAAELALNGIGLDRVEWVEAFDNPGNGHAGCSRSHRELLRRIAAGPWATACVIEDDFQVITTSVLADAGFTPDSVVYRTFCQVLEGRGGLNERFAFLSEYLPEGWDVIYCSGGYGEPPISRVNRHVLRAGFMQGTGCYGITREFARIWTGRVDGALAVFAATLGGDSLDYHPGPIDNVFGSMAHDHHYYVFQPRLAFQRASLSDITGETNSYLFSGTDDFHENLIPQ